CAGGEKYVVQRINTSIFTRPDEVMENILGVTSFLKKKVAAAGGDPMREVLTVIPTVDGKSAYVDEAGGFWRAYLCITGATAHQSATPELFAAAARAFGNFQRLLADYPAEQLHETITNFHNTVSRFADFRAAVAENRSGRAERAAEEIAFAMAREEKCGFIMDGIASGELPLRVTHNDTKLNNVMLDDVNGEGVCVIDLDTVMPGSVLYDFGDAIRFGASSAAEDEADLDKVYLCPDLFEAFTAGFIEGLGGSLSEAELRALPMGAWMMTFEVGIRFLGDYLNGDVYFRTHYPEHNLVRARNQFKLAADIEAKMGQLNAIVEKYIH
ncbi:MAG: aminoglycoside phosphotransferase family protein, partial [Clostridia bacterium]|nr:aminoglycoside phosphotransferase family protein [Clostridia bacterium]